MFTHEKIIYIYIYKYKYINDKWYLEKRSRGEESWELVSSRLVPAIACLFLSLAFPLLLSFFFQGRPNHACMKMLHLRSIEEMPKQVDYWIKHKVWFSPSINYHLGAPRSSMCTLLFLCINEIDKSLSLSLSLSLSYYSHVLLLLLSTKIWILWHRMCICIHK